MKSAQLSRSLILVSAMALPASALAQAEASHPQAQQGPVSTQPQASAPSAVQPVEPKRVCMINNRVMNVDQIPVVIDAKMYFGCCPMCKERLEQNAAARQAVDPVSGKAVDKALAVIGALPNGEVVYFESKDTFQKYAAKGASASATRK